MKLMPSKAPAQAEVEARAVAKADQKLRQKTRKRLLNFQGKEADDDGNLNKSVEELINSTEHPLDSNDNFENNTTNNNIENLPNSDKSKPPGIAESPQSKLTPLPRIPAPGIGKFLGSG